MSEIEAIYNAGNNERKGLDDGELLDAVERLGREELNIPVHYMERAMRLVDKLSLHDNYTDRHSLEVCIEAYEVAKVIGANEKTTYLAGLLHDIGKLYIRQGLLEKSRTGLSWSEEDQREMSDHAKFGYDIVLKDGFPIGVTLAIGAHHEKQRGFAYGLNNDLDPETEQVRRAVASADFVNALITRRNTYATDEDIEKLAMEDLMLLYDGDEETAKLVFKTIIETHSRLDNRESIFEDQDGFLIGV